MGEPVLWVTEDASISLEELRTADQLANYADDQVTSIYCRAKKEFPEKELEATDGQVPINVNISELFFLDSDFDLSVESPEHSDIPLHEPYNMSSCSLTTDSGYSDVKHLLPLQMFQLSTTSFATHSDYYSHTDKASLKLQYCREGSEDSLSLLGRPRCMVCHENPCNTCLMHHLTSHMDLCYSCAVSHFARGIVCPLCSDRILYIYMYEDI